MKKQDLKFSILRVLAHQLQHWAEIVSRQVGEEEQSGQQNQTDTERRDPESAVDAPHVLSSPAPGMEGAGEENPPTHWLMRAGTSEPPADWLAQVRKGAPELLKQEGGTSLTSRSSGPLSRLVNGPGNKRSSPPTGTILAAGDARGLAETNTQEERAPRREEEVHVPPFPRNAAPQSAMLLFAPTAVDLPVGNAEARPRERKTEISWAKKASSEPRQPGRDAPLSPLRRDLNQPAQQSSFSCEERPGIAAYRQADYHLWPQMGLPKAAQGQDLSKASEASAHSQAAMRWPSLPENVTTDTQDWEMAWRGWERRQRLDEEQRGSSWNV